MRYWLATLLLIFYFSTANAVAKRDSVPPVSAVNQIDAIIKRARTLILKQPDSAREIAKETLVLSKRINYKHGIGHSFNVIGVSYWVQSFLPISQFYLASALPYLSDDKNALAGCYRNIARNYVELKDRKMAEFYFRSALRLANQSVQNKALIYTEFTSLYNAVGDHVNGLKYIDTAFRYTRLAHNDNLMGILYDRLGQLYIDTHQIDLAQRTLDTCYQYCLIIRNKRLRSVLFIDEARIAVLKNRLPQAATFANNGYLLADTLGAVELKLRALKVLKGIYEKQGQVKLFTQVQDKISKEYEDIAILNNAKTLQLIQDYFVLNTKLTRIEQANINNNANEVLIHSQHRTIALLVVSLITAVTFLVVIFIYYRQKHELNNKLKVQHKILKDQTALIELQRTDLEEVNRLKDKLLAIIGHDLRTPIASLSSITDLFAAEYISEDELKQLMLDLTPVIKGAELTLANLMEFANSQMKGQKMESANVDICAIADEIKETFAHQLQQKNISFSNHCIDKAGVWADANQLKVIMRNLVSNAIKFTDRNGRIKVITQIRNDRMEVCVEDTGVGMTAEQTNNLFKADRHLSQKGTSGETGTGLGLLLCKDLIELNRGKLRVDTAPGQGCRFFFTLPLFIEAAVHTAV